MSFLEKDAHHARRRAIAAVLGSTLGAGLLAAGALGLVGAVVGVASPAGERAVAQETLLYFQLTPETQAVRMELQPGVSVVKLESLLALPLDTPYDPRNIYPYGLTLKLTDGKGKTLTTQQIHLETRLSRAGWDGERWTWANARVRDGSVELADNRLTEIPVAGASLPQRFLEVTPMEGTHANVLLRAYARRSLPEWEIAMRLKTIGAREAEGLADKVSHRSWAQLEPEEKRALVSFEWLRLSAEGTEGDAWNAIPVWYYGFSLPDAPRTALSRFYLSPWRDAALNVQGPGKIILQRADALEETLPEWPVPLERADQVTVRRVIARGTLSEEADGVGAEAAGADAARIGAAGADAALTLQSTFRAEVAALRDDGWEPEQAEESSAPLRGAEQASQANAEGLEQCRFEHDGDTCTLTLNDAQLQTLRLQAEGGWLGLRYYLQGGASVGDRPVLPESDGRLRIQPDVRTLYTYRVDRNLAPLRVGLLDPSGSTMALVLRPQVPTPVAVDDPRDAQIDMNVAVTVMDSDGKVLTTSACTGPVNASRFEFYRDRQGQLSATGTDVSEAQLTAASPSPDPSRRQNRDGWLATWVDSMQDILPAKVVTMANQLIDITEDTNSESTMISASETLQGFARVGERTQCLVAYPAGARWMEIASARPVDVQLLEQAPWVPQDEYEPPWSLPAHAGAHFRYAPLFKRRWEPVRPVDEAALWQAERVTRIAAQVRLEGSTPRQTVRLTGGKTLTPEGDPLKQILLSPRAGGSNDEGSATLVALTPGVETPVWLNGGPVRLLHRLSNQALGKQFRLLSDGRPLGGALEGLRSGFLSQGSGEPTGGQRIQARMGTLNQGSTAAGLKRLELEGPEGLWLVEGRPASPKARVYRREVVYRLTRDNPIRVSMPMGWRKSPVNESELSGRKMSWSQDLSATMSERRMQPRVLNVQVYVPTAATGQAVDSPIVLSSQVDGGRPRRLGADPLRGDSATPGLSQQRVGVGLKPGALIQDRVEGDVLGPARLVRRLGSDLAPGPHSVEWRLEQGPTAVYLRFFVMDEVSSTSEDARLSVAMAD